MTSGNRYAAGALALAVDGRVARLTLDRPDKRNAITQAMWKAIPQIVDVVAQDPAVRVLVVAGAGETFSAGADIDEFEAVYADAASIAAANEAVRVAQVTLQALDKPTVAEIRGPCVGGGLGLALACDLRFADTTARFAITPARLGLAYSFDDTRRLVDTVGVARAKDILFSARMLGADEALSIGLADRVTDPGDLAPAVSAWAGSVADLSHASISVAKRTVEAIRTGADAADDALRSAFAATFSGPDFAEGRAAFRDKRKPRFP